jgi:hypothetical protein
MCARCMKDGPIPPPIPMPSGESNPETRAPAKSSSHSVGLLSNRSEPIQNSRPNADSSAVGLHQAERAIVTAVANRLVSGWVRQYGISRDQSDSSLRTQAGEPSESGGSSGTLQQGSTVLPLAIGSLKRTGNGQDGDKNNEEDQSQKRRRQKCALNPNRTVRLLACPYQKHDPQRYSETNVAEMSYRGCASCYLPDISRLKYVLRAAVWRTALHDLVRTDISQGNICTGYIADRSSTAKDALVFFAMPVDSMIIPSVNCDVRSWNHDSRRR